VQEQKTKTAVVLYCRGAFGGQREHIGPIASVYNTPNEYALYGETAAAAAVCDDAVIDTILRRPAERET